MMRFSFMLLALVATVATAQESVTLESPGKTVTLQLSMADGKPHWAISFQGTPVVTPSPLGLDVKGNPFGAFKAIEAVTRTEDNTWKPVWGISSSVRDHYNEVTWQLEEQGDAKRRLDVIVRLYDDGAAVRYRLAGSGRVTFSGDQTQFRFAGNPTCWSANGENPNIGPVPLDKFQGGQFPVTLQVAEECFASILEAAIYEFAPISPVKAEANALRTSFSASTVTLPAETSWRVLLLGKTTGDLLTSNVIVNLNPPCKLEDTSWIKPGLSFWDWRAWGGTGKDGFKYNLDMASWRRFIDFASKHNVKYLVLDANWYGHESDPKSNPTNSRTYIVYQPDPKSPKMADRPAPKDWDDPIDVPKLIQYAKERNVGIFLYINDVARKHYNFEKTLATYQKWGAAGIKYGFMKGKGQTGYE